MISIVCGAYAARALARWDYYINAMHNSAKSIAPGTNLDDVNPELFRLLDEEHEDEAFLTALFELLAISARAGGAPIVALTLGPSALH